MSSIRASVISVPPHSTSTGEGGVPVLISDAGGPQRTCVAEAVPSPRPQACLCSDPAAFLRRAASGGGGIAHWLQVAWEARPCSRRGHDKDRCSALDDLGLRGPGGNLSQTRVTSRSPLIQTGKDRTMHGPSEQTRAPARSPWVPPHAPPSAGTPAAPHSQLRDPADLGLAFSGLLTCGHRKPIIITADHLWTQGLRNLCQSPQILNSRGATAFKSGSHEAEVLLCKHPFFPGDCFHMETNKSLSSCPSAGPRGCWGADSLTTD